MYKSKEQLKMMSLSEIARYVVGLENTDDIAKKNGLEYVEWCQNVLMEVLDELNISDEEFEKEILNLKMIQPKSSNEEKIKNF